MNGTKKGGSVQRLLSRMIGAYVSADQSSDSAAFVQHIENSRLIARELRAAAAERQAGSPHGLSDFLEAVNQTTDKGQMPEDRELLGLVDWANRLYEECVFRDGSAEPRQAIAPGE